jgi:hypothetical protein
MSAQCCAVLLVSVLVWFGLVLLNADRPASQTVNRETTLIFELNSVTSRSGQTVAVCSPAGTTAQEADGTSPVVP